MPKPAWADAALPCPCLAETSPLTAVCVSERAQMNRQRAGQRSSKQAVYESDDFTDERVFFERVAREGKKSKLAVSTALDTIRR